MNNKNIFLNNFDDLKPKKMKNPLRESHFETLKTKSPKKSHFEILKMLNPIRKSDFEKLPSTTGVYFFKGPMLWDVLNPSVVKSGFREKGVKEGTFSELFSGVNSGG